jgi:dolichol-phosphate mannosyltransferase
VEETRVELSVVVPVYGCADCLEALYGRLVAVLEPLTEFELIFVDDRGPDASWSVLRNLADQDSRVRLIRLSRNFGQQAAITAGLSKTQARWTVVLDCDLQDPPELIPELLAAGRAGHDVVFARRVARDHSWLRRLGARAYFGFMRVVLGVSIDGGFGAFTLISSRARDSLLALPDADRHYVPMLLWIGYEQTSVDYTVGPRHSGESSYTLGALVRLAISGLMFQTTTLLRWIIYVGIILALLGMLFAVLLVGSYFWIDDPYPGWTSLIVVILVTSGVVALSTGVTGLYVGSVYRQVKARPLFLIDTEYQRTSEGVD